MNHDELLAKLDYHRCVYSPALMAIVKLHKPQEVFTVYGKPYTICAMCDGFQYPCPTLYVIDEELK